MKAVGAVAITLLWLISPAYAGGLDDPFDTRDALHPSAQDIGSCRVTAEGRALTLADVVQISLCNNPQTRAVWASTRVRAAQLGASQASLLPSLSIQGSAGHGAGVAAGTHSVSNSQSASLSVSYLLYDFGGREAAISNARELLTAANASGDATLQSVFLSAVQAYFSLISAKAAVQANLASEKSAAEGLEAAETRYKVGAATPADRLQAKTALSQAKLTRIQAEGAMQSALGTLSNVMGFDPTTILTFAAPPTARPEIQLEDDVGKLIEAAQAQRPDLVAAEAQVRAAESSIELTRASGRPSLTLNGSSSQGRSAVAGAGYASTRNHTVSLNLNFPLFTGFSTSYQLRAAEAQLENSLASRDQLARQVSLQVWQAYQNLRTQGQALRTADDLLASATESEALSLGRYRAGIVSIIDLLTAQSALAGARQQHVAALYNWHAARFSLAQAIGALDLSALQQVWNLE